MGRLGLLVSVATLDTFIVRSLGVRRLGFRNIRGALAGQLGRRSVFYFRGHVYVTESFAQSSISQDRAVGNSHRTTARVRFVYSSQETPYNVSTLLTQLGFFIHIALVQVLSSSSKSYSFVHRAAALA